MSLFASGASHKARHHQSEPTKKKQSRRKLPLAALLVERGFFEQIDEARRWIMAGKVLVNDQLLDKPGMPVPRGAQVRVRGRTRYASRGGYKLEAALAHFAIKVAGRVALDCGACTGGFTDCLLQHGAALVYAVEVGHGQLIERLRADTRVRNMERTNLSDLTSAMLDPTPTLITLDLSYLSLTRALPIVAPLLAPEGDILALVKPLFEVESSEARRSGHIKEPTLLVEALQRVLEAGSAGGLSAQGIVKLALQPRHGVHEYVALFTRRTDALPWCYDASTLLPIVEGPGVDGEDCNGFLSKA